MRRILLALALILCASVAHAQSNIPNPLPVTQALAPWSFNLTQVSGSSIGASNPVPSGLYGNGVAIASGDINDSVGDANGLYTDSKTMLYNGSTFERGRSVIVGATGQSTGLFAIGLYGYNGSTWDGIKDDSNAFLSINVGDVLGSTMSASNPLFAEISDGTRTNTIKASGTSPATTDTALVVTQSPNPAPVCTGVINITQTTTTDVHTFTNYGYICSIVLVSATAQSIGVDEGTGTTCETRGTALIGVSSTASATPTLAVAANGGFSAIGAAPWLKLQASGDHLCIIQSGSGNVSGVITYADHS